jgi:hypothetical protein
MPGARLRTASQRDVAVLALWPPHLLVCQRLQLGAQPLPRLRGAGQVRVCCVSVCGNRQGGSEGACSSSSNISSRAPTVECRAFMASPLKLRTNAKARTRTNSRAGGRRRGAHQARQDDVVDEPGPGSLERVVELLLVLRLVLRHVAALAPAPTRQAAGEAARRARPRRPCRQVRRRRRSARCGRTGTGSPPLPCCPSPQSGPWATTG